MACAHEATSAEAQLQIIWFGQNDWVSPLNSSMAFHAATNTKQ